MNDDEQQRLFNLCSDKEFFKRFWAFIDKAEMTPDKALSLYNALLEQVKVGIRLSKDYKCDEFAQQARYLALTIAAGLCADVEEMSTNGGLE